MSDKKLLRQFLDSFQRLDDCLVFDKEVSPEMIVKRDVEDWESWDELQKWQPISVKFRRLGWRSQVAFSSLGIHGKLHNQTQHYKLKSTFEMLGNA